MKLLKNVLKNPSMRKLLKIFKIRHLKAIELKEKAIVKEEISKSIDPRESISKSIDPRNSSVVRVYKPSQFRLSAKRVYLTYSQVGNLTKEVCLDMLTKKFLLEGYLLGQELHLDGNVHIHVLLFFPKKLDIKSNRSFDLFFEGNVLHPHIKSIYSENLSQLVSYCTKGKNFISHNLPVFESASLLESPSLLESASLLESNCSLEVKKKKETKKAEAKRLGDEIYKINLEEGTSAAMRHFCDNADKEVVMKSFNAKMRNLASIRGLLFPPKYREMKPSYNNI
jgi:hypothetical protein